MWHARTPRNVLYFFVFPLNMTSRVRTYLDDMDVHCALLRLHCKLDETGVCLYVVYNINRPKYYNNLRYSISVN